MKELLSNVVKECIMFKRKIDQIYIAANKAKENRDELFTYAQDISTKASSLFSSLLYMEEYCKKMEEQKVKKISVIFDNPLTSDIRLVLSERGDVEHIGNSKDVMYKYSFDKDTKYERIIRISKI